MLQRYREKAGLTQAQVAGLLGYSSPQFISNIECGRAELPAEKFKKVSKIFGIPIETLIDLKITHTKRKLKRFIK